MESEFYVTLPSNSSMQYFPDNKTSNLVAKLSRTPQLDGEWEVGLAEIVYPHTWYNIRAGKNSSLQRGGNVPFYRGPVLQRGYGLGSIFKSVARSVMPSLKEIGKSALTTDLEVLQDVAKGENIKTAAKKRLKENSLAFLDDTVSRMSRRKSIKGNANKQISISSSKPKKRKPSF